MNVKSLRGLIVYGTTGQYQIEPGVIFPAQKESKGRYVIRFRVSEHKVDRATVSREHFEEVKGD